MSKESNNKVVNITEHKKKVDTERRRKEAFMKRLRELMQEPKE